MPKSKIGPLTVIILVTIVAAAACGRVNDTTAYLGPAPDFEFRVYQRATELGGNELSLSNLRGKPVVLNFWAGLCPPCRAEMPDLQEFYDDYGDKATLLGLDVGPFTGLGSNQSGRDLLEELGITYPAGFARDAEAVIDYEILGMPSTVFITADGKIFRKWDGLLNKAKLVEITEQMLARS